MSRFSTVPLFLCFVGLCSAQARMVAQDTSSTLVCDSANLQCTHEFLNGKNYKTLTTAQAVVIVSPASNGKYMRLDVSFSNGGTGQVDVLPKSFKLQAVTPKTKALPEIPPEKIVASEKHRAGWANALNAFGAGMATRQVTTQTSTNGTVQASGNDGSYANGTYSGTSTSTTSVPNYAAQAQARENIARRRAALNAMEVSMQTSSLRENTVQPGQSVRGFVYFEAEKHGKDFVLELPIGGVTYRFPLTLLTVR